MKVYRIYNVRSVALCSLYYSTCCLVMKIGSTCVIFCSCFVLCIQCGPSEQCEQAEDNSGDMSNTSYKHNRPGIDAYEVFDHLKINMTNCL